MQGEHARPVFDDHQPQMELPSSSACRTMRYPEHITRPPPKLMANVRKRTPLVLPRLMYQMDYDYLRLAHLDDGCQL